MLSRARPSLRQGLDRDIYQIVRKLEDELEGTKSGKALRISTVYEYIKHSNSSLARQKKRPLEDAIERVLSFRKDELKEDDSDAELEAAAAKSPGHSHERDSFILNKQLTKHWNFASGSAPSSSGRQSPAISGAGPMDVDGGSGNGGVSGVNGAAIERQPNGEPKAKRRRREKDNDRSPPTGISIADMAGIQPVLKRLYNPVYLPLTHGDVFARLHYRFNDGVLLHGPSGCGKTTLADALAAALGVAYIPISGPSLVAGTSGESEKNIRELFDEAIRLAPCLIFIDEIDSIAGKRDSAQKAMENRMVTEINRGMDRIARDTGEGKYVVVLAATNRPDSIEPVIRRRFAHEVDMGMPDEKAREQILRAMTRELPLSSDVDFAALARLTPGYVGADLKHVVDTAVFEVVQSVVEARLTETRAQEPDALPGLDVAQQNWLLLKDRPFEQEADIYVTLDHLKHAISLIQPAAKREGFSTIPDTTWSNVGALHEVRTKLEMTIIGPITQPERFAQVGIQTAAGILLWGPPGCGKTLVAKAVANESKANFISIKGPELLNKYVGESERAVRQLFGRARSSAPCILFFDEMDALVPRRDDNLNDASARVVNTLLTELDGVGDRSGIYVVGATNRPDIIDPAIRRPGRLGTSVYVGLPSPDERVDILRTIYRNTITNKGQGTGTGTDAGVDLEKIARDKRCTGFSGADLGNLMQAAAQACLQRTYNEAGTPHITAEDWQKALREVKPSVTDISKYLDLLA